MAALKSLKTDLITLSQTQMPDLLGILTMTSPLLISFCSVQIDIPVKYTGGNQQHVFLGKQAPLRPRHNFSILSVLFFLIRFNKKKAKYIHTISEWGR